MREFKGVVKNGVVVLEDGNELPEGTKVRVIVEETMEWRPDWDGFWQCLREAWSVGLREGEQPAPDVSEKVDEYLAEAFLRREHSPPSAEGSETK
ncbi:MAG: hypothetical protein PVTTEEND_000912 [Candidatus Fervidibacter sp.]|jgi:hypothetical protein